MGFFLKRSWMWGGEVYPVVVECEVEWIGGGNWGFLVEALRGGWWSVECDLRLAEGFSVAARK